MLNPGLYEQVINSQIKALLQEIPEVRKSVAQIDQADPALDRQAQLVRKLGQ